MSRDVAASIACIGAGYWGKNLVRNFQSLQALSWICEADPVRRRELAEATPGLRITDSLDQVLEDPAVQGVAIATPAETHGDLVRRALSAGKDVFVEKPLCLSIEEGEDLARLAASKGECSWWATCSGTIPPSSGSNV